MASKIDIRLTAVEIASLWTLYMSESLACCVLQYFANQTEDGEILSLVRHALTQSENNLSIASEIIRNADLPVPDGFTAEDVNADAPRLFSDPFYAYYIADQARVGMEAYAASLFYIARPDVRRFFSDCVEASIKILNMTADILLRKGLYLRAPTVEIPKEVSYVAKPDFMAGILMRDPRPLTTIEIDNMFGCILRNHIGGLLVTGFAQVAQSDEVRGYMQRAKELGKHHYGIFASHFEREDLPVASTHDTAVTGSTEPPFSDKLMMFHVITLSQVSMIRYGVSLSTSMRRDVQAMYTRVIAEVGLFAQEGADIMIANGWLEQPPQAIRHEALSRA